MTTENKLHELARFMKQNDIVIVKTAGINGIAISIKDTVFSGFVDYQFLEDISCEKIDKEEYTEIRHK